MLGFQFLPYSLFALLFRKIAKSWEDNNHTRRRVYREQIGEANWNLVTRKKGLADSRLVVTSRSNEDRETLEVVHEALIRHWTRLQDWIGQDRLNLDKQREIEDAALNWYKLGKKIDYLLSNKRLRDAKEFQKEQQIDYPLSDLSKSFITSSKKQQRKQQTKSLGLFLIIPLIGTVIGAPVVITEINLNGDKKLVQDCEGKENCSGRIQALERLVKAQKSLKFYNLSHAYLDGINLGGAYLRGADLSNADLSHANLNYATLLSADLGNADFSNARLYNAVLDKANLGNADLSHAGLDNAGLDDAFLVSANLSNARLYNARLHRANLNHADLNNARLKNTDLSDATLVGANLNNTYLFNENDLTFSQIKSACNWEKAIYKSKYIERSQDNFPYLEKFILYELASQKYIEKLKQDKASDPKDKVDCSRWE